MKLRKKFLIELLEKDNPSGMESVITPMVVQELNNLGFKVSLDDIGNISAIRGSATKYPLFNAHLDQVDFVDYGSYTTWYNKDSKSTKDTYSYYDDDFLDWDDIDDLEKVVGCLSTEELADVFTCDDCFKRAKCPNYEYKMLCDNFDANYSSYDKLAKFAVREWGWTPKEKDKPQQLALKFMVYESKGKLYGTGGRVLGGDDKAGIFIILELARLLRYTPMKVLFTVKEEVGCVGIKHFAENNSEWFDDVAYSITVDRRYGNNLLWSQLGKRSCTNEFAGRLAMAGITVGIPIEIQDGSVADVITIREYVTDSVNVSAGYYNPHSDDEYVNLEEITKIIKWLRLFVNNEKERCQ